MASGVELTRAPPAVAAPSAGELQPPPSISQLSPQHPLRRILPAGPPLAGNAALHAALHAASASRTKVPPKNIHVKGACDACRGRKIKVSMPVLSYHVSSSPVLGPSLCHFATVASHCDPGTELARVHGVADGLNFNSAPVADPSAPPASGAAPSATTSPAPPRRIRKPSSASLRCSGRRRPSTRSCAT